MATKIVYIGSKPMKADNVAQTGLTWIRGEIHIIEDEVKANKLLEHPHVWADAEKEYSMFEPEVAQPETPEPRVNIVPQGGEDVSQYWDPIVIPVPGEVFNQLTKKEMIAVFMTPENADAFEVWKNHPKVKEKMAKEALAKVEKELEKV